MTTITALPTPPSTASPSNFDALSDAFLGALPAFGTEANAVASEMAANAAAAAASAAAAAVSAASTGATAWVSGTYTLNQAAISPINFQTYRCKVAGSRTIDPSADPTNWAPLVSLNQGYVALPANNIDLTSANYFSKTISGATTLTVTNVPAAGLGVSIILELTNGGSAVITWGSGFTAMKWSNGAAPTLTASGKDVVGLWTRDGGATWNAALLMKAVA